MKEENKKIVSNIKAKMFKGYHQVIKKKEKRKKIRKIKKYGINIT